MQYLKNVDSPQISLWVQGHSATFQQRFACESGRILTFLSQDSTAGAGLLAPRGTWRRESHGHRETWGVVWMALAQLPSRGEQTARRPPLCRPPRVKPCSLQDRSLKKKTSNFQGNNFGTVPEGPANGDHRSDEIHESSNEKQIKSTGRGLRTEPSLRHETARAQGKREPRLGRGRVDMSPRRTLRWVSTGTVRVPFKDRQATRAAHGADGLRGQQM